MASPQQRKRVGRCICPACADTGLLLPGQLCPLCEGHGAQGMLRWEGARSTADQGRLLVQRVLRTGCTALTSEEHSLVQAALRPHHRPRTRCASEQTHAEDAPSWPSAASPAHGGCASAETMRTYVP